jgi:hypothetical protein
MTRFMTLDYTGINWAADRRDLNDTLGSTLKEIPRRKEQ